MNITIRKTISTWMEDPKQAAKRLVDYYGEPDEYSKNRLIWHNTYDGWKKTELVNQMVAHNFPAPHHDYLEQWIDYQVPLDMFDSLATFDGSVIAERTKGEISARCGGTSMNFVAINLAHDILTKNKTIQEARNEYTRLYKAYQNGKKPAYTQKLQFDLPQGDTTDPDVARYEKF